MCMKFENNVFDDLLKNMDIDVSQMAIEEDMQNSFKEDEQFDNESSDNKYVRIIAIDETGRFESIWTDNIDLFCSIGGIYKDIEIPENGEVEALVNKELNKMYNFFNDFIDSFNAQNNKMQMHMPESLHGSKIYIIDKKKNKKITKKIFNDLSVYEKQPYSNFKEEFNNSLKEAAEDFLKSNGYHLFSYILSKNQILQIETNDVSDSNIVSYHVGGNLYQDMLIRTINNLIFYDYKKTIADVCLFCATRIIDNNFENEYDAIYDNIVNKENPEINLQITNTNYVKASLMHKVNNDYIPNKNIHIGLMVYSIPYRKRKDLSEYEWKNKQITSSLLYMADVACGIIRDKYCKNPDGNYRKKNNESLLITTSNEFIEEGHNIRFISEPDKMFDQMVEHYYKGELIDYYSLKYDFIRRGVSHKDEISWVSKFYIEKWIPGLEDKLASRLSEDNNYKNDVIRRLPEYYSKNNGYMGTLSNEYEKGRFVALCMCNILDTVKDAIHSKIYLDKYLFKFNDIVVRGLNHRGDISRIDEYLNVCTECGYSVGIEDYLEHKQRAVQRYFNSMDYDHIIENYYKDVLGKFSDGRWNISNVEKLKEAMSLISDQKTQGYLLIGKIYSTLAQALAFEGSNNAEYYFDLAIKEMGDDIGNINITRSYLMHYYCDKWVSTKDSEYKEKFEKEAIEYFHLKKGEKFDLECLKTIFAKIMDDIEKNNESRFALYLFIKALRVLYLPEYIDNAAFIMFVNNISKKIHYYCKSINNTVHPWELIYINMYLILECTGGKIKDKYLKEIFKPERVNNNGPAIAAIILKFGLDIDYKGCWEVVKRDDLIDIDGLEKIVDMSDSEIKEVLNKKLTYMYN